MWNKKYFSILESYQPGCIFYVYFPDLATMTDKELERSNFKQAASLRLIVSPLMISLDSAAMHRIQYLLECFHSHHYAPYEDIMGTFCF